MKLQIAKDLSLPLDAVTQTFLIVGKRGSGKSNTAARLVEQFHRARLPFVVLDPVDTWWGLKAGRDGEKGLDVYVFGGRKQDLPLNAGDGALIADVLCDHRASMVLSVKHLSGRERSAFMVAFAQTLFQKWGGGPLHVVLEEAHELAPQMAASRGGSNADNEAAMLGAFKRLWKLGRASGIGGSAITQRPASLSKDITTQSEILIAHRTIGPQDVDAIGQWVKYHGEKLDILAELPSLPTGDAFVWAPEFPEGKALGLVRTSVLLRETYDSASTPKVGEQRVEPKELAPVDLERLRVKMSATIEKAKADDPRELRKQIADLKKQIATAKTASDYSKIITTPQKVKEIHVLKDEQLARAERVLAQIEKAAERFSEFENDLRVTAKEIRDAIASTRAASPESVADFGRRFEAAAQRDTPTTTAQRRPSPVSPQVRQPAEKVQRAASLVSPSSNGNGSLPPARRRILNALAFLHGIGVHAVDKTQLALMSDVPPTRADRERIEADLRELEHDAERDLQLQSAWVADVARRALSQLSARSDALTACQQERDDEHEKLLWAEGRLQADNLLRVSLEAELTACRAQGEAMRAALQLALSDDGGFCCPASTEAAMLAALSSTPTEPKSEK